MNIRPIKTGDYDAALIVIEELMGAAPESPEGDELAILVTLVEPTKQSTPMRHRSNLGDRARHGGSRCMYQKDFNMGALIGSQPHASEVPIVNAGDPAR